MSLPKWKKLNQKSLFKNKHWEYRLDHFEIENGFKGEYHYVHSPGSTLVIPLISPDKVILINQYRYLNQKEGLEFPCGSIEGEITLEQNALKELREETKYSAELEKIGEFSPYTGVSNEICHVFLGTELKLDPLPSDSTEEFELFEYSYAEMEELISKNIIWDGLTLAAWILLKKHLKI